MAPTFSHVPHDLADGRQTSVDFRNIVLTHWTGLRAAERGVVRQTVRAVVAGRAGELGADGALDRLVRRLIRQVASVGARRHEHVAALRPEQAVGRLGSVRARLVRLHDALLAARARDLIAGIGAFARWTAVVVRFETVIASDAANR